MKTRIEIIDNTSKVIARRFCYPGEPYVIDKEKLASFRNMNHGVKKSFNTNSYNGLVAPGLIGAPLK